VEPVGSVEGREFYQGLLEALAQGMGLANGYLFEHGPRTAVMAHALGVELGLDEDELAELFFGAVLADLGMIGLVEDAWEDPVPVLADRARREVENHPRRSAAGARVIPFLQGAEGLILYHHEWWDGSGYPRGLQGDEIPLGARVLRIADTVAALGEPRPHRPPRSDIEIRRIIVDGLGSEFDPMVGRLWLSLDAARAHPTYSVGRYRELRASALERLVPRKVPLSSSGVLLELFSSLIDAKDPYTGGHSRRVARLAEGVSQALGLSAESQRHARAAGYLHDLGKLSVPARILRKDQCLSSDDWQRVRHHAADGASLLDEIPALRSFAPACRYHHERWDGTGYLEGLSREQIPLMARILAICDAYDAMTSARAYRPALGMDYALAEIAAGRGIQFGPSEVDAFLSLPAAVLDAISEIERDGAAISPFLLGPPGERGGQGLRVASSA
jgi:HD-GYP domain-containing protein (c-di-GMP phosphodiesterase class II)